MDELEKIKYDLTKMITGFHTPKSTRWNRNHTARAEWYLICKEKFGVTLDNL